jgi:small subunit ribosomal protein S33
MNSSKLSPAMKAIIADSARKVFGNRPVVPYRTGFKHLARRPVAPVASNYYVMDMTRSFKAVAKDYTSEIEERRTEALARLRRRGKGPPTKGQGKRASRKK